MRCLVRLLFVSLVLAAAPAAASECPMCKPIDDWFAQNGAACGYHGNRLPSICETDPECVEWNRVCGAKREELNACIQRCMSGEQPPPPPQSQVPELDEFDRDVAEMERTGYVVHNNQQSPEWCRQARNRLAAVDPELFAGGLVGRISDAGGTARVNLCTGGVVNAEPGMPVRVGDCIETGPEGKVRILVNHDIDLSPDEPSIWTFGASSRICIDELQKGSGIPNRDGSLLTLIKGSVRAVVKRWKNRRIFNVRGMTRITGVRGSEVIVRREPSDGSVQVGVKEGHAWIGNRVTREIRYLEAGQWAQDRATGMTQVQAMSRADWDRVIQQDGLDFQGAAVDPSGPACGPVVGRWQWANGNIFVFTADQRWVRPDTPFRGEWRCQTNSRGQNEVKITPEDGGWWTVVQIAPDGSSMSGIGDNGIESRAVRLSP